MVIEGGRVLVMQLLLIDQVLLAPVDVKRWWRETREYHLIARLALAPLKLPISSCVSRMFGQRMDSLTQEPNCVTSPAALTRRQGGSHRDHRHRHEKMHRSVRSGIAPSATGLAALGVS